MALIPPISSIANPHGVTARADGVATITGAVGAAGIISIKSITPKTITTKA